MDKHGKNKISLFDAVCLNKKEMFSSLWRIELNFNLYNLNEIKKYCVENGLKIIDTKDNFNIKFQINKKFYLESIKDNFFKTTATINENNEFQNFGINNISSVLYGKSIKDIIHLRFKINTSEINNVDIDYWGFYEYKSKEFIHIDKSYLLLNMRFGCSIEDSEKNGKGFACKLNLEII